jgi:hypothetical protein
MAGRALHRRPPTRRVYLVRRLVVAGGLLALGLGAAGAAGVFSSSSSSQSDLGALRGRHAPQSSTPASRETIKLPTAKGASPARVALPARVGKRPKTSAPTTSAPTTSAPTTSAPAIVPEPSQVLVEVLNGSGVAMEATRAGAALQRDGFLLNGTGNAKSFLYRTTLVLYPPGSYAAAALVASKVLGAVELEESPVVPAGVVDVVLGDSYRGILPG